MNWSDLYRDRVQTAAQAVRHSADLYGKTIAQRAAALIAIAAPECRDELTHQARELKYL